MKKLERVAARVEQRRTREADKQEVMMAREDDVATHPEALRRELERIEIALENVNAARDAGDGVEEARDLAEAAEALERAVERNADAVQEGLAERARRAEQSAERSVMRRAEAADEEMETLKRVVEDAEVREESDDAAEDAETEAELEMLQARLDAIRLEEKRALEQARGVEMTPTAERQAMKDAVVGPDVAPAPDSAEEAEAFSVVGPRRRARARVGGGGVFRFGEGVGDQVGRRASQGGDVHGRAHRGAHTDGGGGGDDRVRRSRGEGDHGRCLQ